MAKVKVTWRETPFKIAITSNVTGRLDKASKWLVKELKKVVGVSAGGNSKFAKRVRRNRSHERHEEFRHSLPGEPPRKITGFLQRSIEAKVNPGDRKRVRSFKVGIFRGALYGWYLEKGVRNEDGSWRIRPRPWLVKTVRNSTKTLQRIIAGEDV